MPTIDIIAGILQQQGGGGFSPNAVAGLSLWLDPDDAATLTDAGSGALSQWDDKSSNGFDFTQTVAANRPTITAAAVNGRTAISFDGVNDRMERAASAIFGADGSATLFVVFVTDTVAAGQGHLVDQDVGGGGRNPQWLRRNAAAIESIVFSGVTAVTDGSGETINTGTTYIAEAVMDGDATDGRSVEALLSGAGDGASSVAGAFNTTATAIAIGSRATYTSGFFRGLIGEVICYDNLITSSDRLAVRSYLSTKWAA